MYIHGITVAGIRLQWAAVLQVTTERRAGNQMPLMGATHGKTLPALGTFQSTGKIQIPRFVVGGISIGDIAANTGRNGNFLVSPGNTRSYTLYAEREGAFAATSQGATFGGQGGAGNVANGLFGQVVVVPKGGRTFRNTLTEEEMRLASTGRTATGQPVIDYQARYPQAEPWITEGKAGKPIIAMVDGNEILNSETDAIVMGPNPDGSFPRSTYPLESKSKRNPTYPNRLEPFRDFAQVWHDEVTKMVKVYGAPVAPGCARRCWTGCPRTAGWSAPAKPV